MIEKQTEIAIGIVIDHDMALVIERQQREMGRNGKPIVWAFPAGKLKEDELPDQAACREVEEETGIIVEPIKIITAEDHPQYPVFAHYVACSLLGEIALHQLPKEIVAVDWVLKSALAELFSWPINEEVRAYIKHPAE